MANDEYKRNIILPTGCTVNVNEHRSLIELPTVVNFDDGSSRNDNNRSIVSWNAISSAIWNGGPRSFHCSSNTIPASEEQNIDNNGSDKPQNQNQNQKVCVLNYKVPSTYDGLNPEPKCFLRTAIGKEQLCNNGSSDNNDDNDDNNNHASSSSSSPSSLFCDEEKTVGLMTAASMQSLRTASRSAGGVIVDVIVTAGISNARSAGADADCFYMFPPTPPSQNDKGCDDDNDNDDDGGEGSCKKEEENEVLLHPSKKEGDKSQTNLRRRRGQQQQQQQQQQHEESKNPPYTPGTINTVVIINAPLSAGAMVEAYAIVIEAKCAACADLRVTCAKSLQSLYGSNIAQGTGTDCAVLLTPGSKMKTTTSNDDGTSSPSKNANNNTNDVVIEYAGKHILLAEMVGQAVREATREAILSNIYHIHGGSLIRYNIYQWYRSFMGILQGARPCVPPFPMMPVPRAPLSVIIFGLICVLASYCITPFIGQSATILIAATFWDR
jgi:adenosylcobinamide amidohydrolase